MTLSGPALTADDRWAIADLVAAYGAYLDRRWIDRLAEVFAADIEIDYDLVGVRRGLEAVLEFFGSTVHTVQATQHLMHTTLVEPDGDGARGFVHVTAHHVAAGAPLPAPPEHVYTVSGTYTDRYVRTPAGWRIAHRKLALLTTLGDPTLLTLHR